MSRTFAVTGVANGIGRELAAILKADGHKIIGLDIAEPDDHVDQFIQTDLSDPGSVAQAVEAVKVELNGICNSAGLPPRLGLETKILLVNFLGTRELTRSLTSKIRSGGSIVSLASRAGHRWREGVEQIKRLAAFDTVADIEKFVAAEKIDSVRAYDLSKEAIIVWTMANSENYANRGVRMNSISPGAVQTGILSDFAAAFGERMSKNVERAGRPGSPTEIAKLAAFLLSDDSGWIKGTDVTIDGGMSAFQTSDALSLECLADSST